MCDALAAPSVTRSARARANKAWISHTGSRRCRAQSTACSACSRAAAISPVRVSDAQFVGVASQLIAQVQRRVAGTLGVILVGDRRPEQRHNAVAGELID